MLSVYRSSIIDYRLKACARHKACHDAYEALKDKTTQYAEELRLLAEVTHQNLEFWDGVPDDIVRALQRE